MRGSGPSLAPVEVAVAVTRGGDLSPVVLRAEVRPPTVAQAVGVLSGGSALRSAVRSWFPPRLASDVAPLSDEALASVALRVLARFTPALGARHDDETEEPGDPLASVAAGAVELGAAPDDVLAMPWPVYVHAVAALGPARDRARVDAATAARMAQADAPAWRRFVASAARRRPRPVADREAARAQAAYVEAQVAAFERTGSTALPSDWTPAAEPRGATEPATAAQDAPGSRPRSRERKTPGARSGAGGGDTEDEPAASSGGPTPVR